MRSGSRRRAARTGSAGKGISFSALAGVASLLAAILLLPLIIATVGPEDYGVWLVILAIASFLFYLDLGVGSAVVHFMSRSRSGDDSSSPDAIASTAHAWSVVAAIGATVAFGILSWAYISSQRNSTGIPHGDLVILIGCGYALVLSMVLRPMSSILSGAGFLHIERGNQIFGVAIRILGTLAACSFVPSIGAVAIAETLALVAPTIASLVGVRKRNLVRIRVQYVSRSELQRMFRYSVGAFSVSMVGAAILQCGTLLIGYMGTPAQVTYFNAAFRIYSSVRQIIGWLTDPFRPVLSRLFVKDHAKAGSVLYDLLFVAFITSATGCVFLILSLPLLLEVWLGQGAPLLEVQNAASILLAGLILNAIHIPLIPASDAAGRPGAFLPHQTAWLISYAALSIVLFPHFGITGVALAMTAPLPAIELAYLIRAQSTVGLAGKMWHKRVIRPSMPVLFVGLLAALFIFATQGDLYIIIASLGFIIVTFVTLFLSRNHWSYRSILSSLRLES